jgi:hypothetical protein
MRFPGKPIAIPSTTELLHRSPPALNSLSGFAIERAGSAKCTAGIILLVPSEDKAKNSVRRVPLVASQAEAGWDSGQAAVTIKPTAMPTEISTKR